MSVSVRLVAALVIALVPAGALAAGPADAPGVRDDKRARDLYSHGVGLFESGQYDLAASSFERAWELSRRPDLLYNVARAREEMGDLTGAVAALRKLIAEGGRAGDEKALAKLSELEARWLREDVTVEVDPTPGPSGTIGRGERGGVVGGGESRPVDPWADLAAPAPNSDGVTRDRPAAKAGPSASAAPMTRSSDQISLDFGRGERRSSAGLHRPPGGPALLLGGGGVAAGMAVLAGWTYVRGQDAREAGDREAWETLRPWNNLAIGVAVGAGLSSVAGIVVTVVESRQGESRLAFGPGPAPVGLTVGVQWK
jgi:hypothetical protein